MIIGLNGKMQSGKDTVYSTITKYYIDAERRSFAGKLKQSVAALFDISMDTIEQNKNNRHFGVCIGPFAWRDSEVTKSNYITHPISILTIRELLQRYGTEAHRDIFGKDFWIEQCLPSTESYDNRLIVVTDCRYENEARHIRSLGGCVVLIQREMYRAVQLLSHTSEKDLPEDLIDYVIDNNGDIDVLENNVKLFLDWAWNKESSQV